MNESVVHDGAKQGRVKYKAVSHPPRYRALRRDLRCGVRSNEGVMK